MPDDWRTPTTAPVKQHRRIRRRARIPRTLYEEVLYSGPCDYCGDTLPTHVDHVEPVSKGGSAERDNLVPACRRCNLSKHDDTVEEWELRRERQGLPFPPLPKRAIIEFFVADLMSENPPRQFVADLCGLLNEERTDAACYEADPRWVLAEQAWLVGRPDLSENDRFFRQGVASEVMFRIERAYEKRAVEDGGLGMNPNHGWQGNRP
jgi:hypothetical protein